MLVEIDPDSADRIVISTIKESIKSLQAEIAIMQETGQSAGIWSWDLNEDIQKGHEMINAMKHTLTWYYSES